MKRLESRLGDANENARKHDEYIATCRSNLQLAGSTIAELNEELMAIRTGHSSKVEELHTEI